MVALLLSFYFAAKYTSFSENNALKYVYLISSFVVVSLFCGLRFFVGNDYPRYVDGFYLLRQYGSNVLAWEPMYYALNLLFFSNDVGYFYVFLISTLISYFFIYALLCREDILEWGVFFLFTLGLLIFMNNGIRQGIAISIFIYSTRFLKENRLGMYILFILLATLFHYTALVLIVVYFIRNLRFSSFTWILLLCITFMLQCMGVFHTLLFKIASCIPYYNFYVEKENLIMSNEAAIGIGILFKFSLSIIVALFYNQIKCPMYATLFLLGAVCDNIFIGSLSFERISAYLLYTNIIVFAYMVKQPSLKQVSNCVIVIVFIYFAIQSLTGLEKNGAVPYRTIFNENLLDPPSEYYDDK